MSTGKSGVEPSSRYEVYLDPRAQRDLERLNLGDRRRIDEHIVGLESNPRPYGVKKLGGDTYRVRVGDWRIIYIVDDDAKRVLISRIKRREKDTYSRL
ncbi:MAG: type II toxin-antitoxin system RelE/ParE family toxin [Chloroflexi bacterium]|nr:type II toxin-antitoxin system RelE/ParE family toxin [Chloroflexota bacterium]